MLQFKKECQHSVSMSNESKKKKMKEKIRKGLKRSTIPGRVTINIVS